jgi:hypothetical protein
MDLTLRDFEIVAITLLLRDGGAWAWRVYQNRYIEPKKRHRQVFVDEAKWFEERAAKLAAFHWQLGQDPPPDKWKLTAFISKLDDHDRQWAMKQTDIEILRKFAAEKGAECHDNAGECGRFADEIAYTIFSM